jgi:hypothetical protein
MSDVLAKEMGYQTPPNFEHRINQFSLAIQQKYEGEEVPKLSLLDMRDFCDIFLHMNCMEWNEVEGPEFCSRYSATLKKRSFIDLDAAKHNVCLFLRTKLREDDAFEAKFQAEHAPSDATDGQRDPA